MISIDKLIGEIQGVKKTSQDLTYILTASQKNLSDNCRTIHGMVQGSRTGMEAVVALMNAGKSLDEAVLSMRQLSVECDKNVNSLRR